MCERLLEHRGYCVIPALTGSTCGPKAWPEWREPGFLRMDYSEACSNQRSRGSTKTSSASLPLMYLPPSALSLSTLQCLFSGRPGFLRDGAVDERRKRGMGQRGKDRQRERWMGMGWWSCARSDLGDFAALVASLRYCKRVWETWTGKIRVPNLCVARKLWLFFVSCIWEKSYLSKSRQWPNVLLGFHAFWVYLEIV